MHAMVGETANVPVQDVLQWDEQSVDLNTFNLPESFAMIGIKAGQLAGLTVMAICLLTF